MFTIYSNLHNDLKTLIALLCWHWNLRKINTFVAKNIVFNQPSKTAHFYKKRRTFTAQSCFQKFPKLDISNSSLIYRCSASFCLFKRFTTNFSFNLSFVVIFPLEEVFILFLYKRLMHTEKLYNSRRIPYKNRPAYLINRFQKC